MYKTVLLQMKCRHRRYRVERALCIKAAEKNRGALRFGEFQDVMSKHCCHVCTSLWYKSKLEVTISMIGTLLKYIVFQKF